MWVLILVGHKINAQNYYTPLSVPGGISAYALDQLSISDIHQLSSPLIENYN